MLCFKWAFPSLLLVAAIAGVTAVHVEPTIVPQHEYAASDVEYAEFGGVLKSELAVELGRERIAPSEFHEESVDFEQCSISNLTYNELAALYMPPALARTVQAFLHIFNEGDDVEPTSEALVEAKKAATDMTALLTLLNFAYPVVKTEEKGRELLASVLHALSKANGAVELFAASMSLSEHQLATERSRMLATVKDMLYLLRKPKVDEYLCTPSRHHLHMRARKALPGHCWDKQVPETLPSADFSGMGNMARLMDVYVKEAHDEWMSALADESPELRGLEPVLVHLAYRLDCAELVARLFPCIWKDEDQGNDFHFELNDFRAKEAQVARGLQLYRIYVSKKEFAHAQQIYEEIAGQWQALRDWQATLAPNATFASLVNRISLNLDMGTPASGSPFWNFLLLGLCVTLLIPTLLFGALYLRKRLFAGSGYQLIDS